jgi:hypothetical protein
VRAGGRGGMTGGPRTAAEDIVAAARRRGGAAAVARAGRQARLTGPRRGGLWARIGTIVSKY